MKNLLKITLTLTAIGVAVKVVRRNKIRIIVEDLVVDGLVTT